MAVTHKLQLGPAYATFTDDTEESIVGADYHQEAILTLASGLRACGSQRDLPWCVGNQLRLVFTRTGARDLVLMPDILVHPTLGQNPYRDTLYAPIEGVPTLVIEVASPSTVLHRDLQDKHGLYLQMGIAEYLVFDPSARFIPALVAAWTLDDTGEQYQPWQAEADARWHSRLGVSFQPQGLYLRVYDQDGTIVPAHWEYEALQRQLLRQHAEDTANQRRLTEQLDERIAQLDERTAQLDERTAQLEAERQRIAALEAELRRLRGE